jgi:hypothetical protein
LITAKEDSGARCNLCVLIVHQLNKHAARNILIEDAPHNNQIERREWAFSAIKMIASVNLSTVRIFYCKVIFSFLKSNALLIRLFCERNNIGEVINHIIYFGIYISFEK